MILSRDRPWIMQKHPCSNSWPENIFSPVFFFTLLTSGALKIFISFHIRLHNAVFFAFMQGKEKK